MGIVHVPLTALFHERIQGVATTAETLVDIGCIDVPVSGLQDLCSDIAADLIDLGAVDIVIRPRRGHAEKSHKNQRRDGTLFH
jgi:hypothetical protein